jgi:hypothetical protein
MNTPAPPGAPESITHGTIVATLPQDRCEQHEGAVMRGRLEELRAQAVGAASWLETARQFGKLINGDGVVPVTARFRRQDLEFLARARTEVLAFAEYGLCLLDMHQPVDAGGISSDPSSPVRRCGSCMRLWPCPTLRAFTEVFGHGRDPGRSAGL